MSNTDPTYVEKLLRAGGFVVSRVAVYHSPALQPILETLLGAEARMSGVEDPTRRSPTDIPAPLPPSPPPVNPYTVPGGPKTSDPVEDVEPEKLPPRLPFERREPREEPEPRYRPSKTRR